MKVRVHDGKGWSWSIMDKFRVAPQKVIHAAGTRLTDHFWPNGNRKSGANYWPDTSRNISLSNLIPEESLTEETKEGLCNARAITFLILWYFFSFCTLFLNKYILTTLDGDATLLAAIQMVMTLVCGFIQMHLPLGMYQPLKREGKPPNFIRNMLLVGCTRFATVILGLVALEFVAVSFTETIKSSAPIFTVLIAWLILGERTGVYTNMSLIPVMGGLALCSSYELSFHLYGFIASLATNITECLQNVFSKMLVSGKKYRYTPAELQFYTSVASVLVEIPALFVMVDFEKAQRTNLPLAVSFILNGIFFHFQSITAYVLMGYISPVTHSVANTAKRALLIWLSVLVFGNQVTFLSGVGTSTVLLGVLLYNKAKEIDARTATSPGSQSKAPILTSINLGETTTRNLVATGHR